MCTWCGTCASTASGAGAWPLRAATTSVTRRSKSCQPCQVCRFAYWSAPISRNHCASGVLHQAHRVQRVADTVAVELAAVEREAWLARDGQRDHLGAVLGAGEPAIFLPRAARGNPVQFIQAQRLHRRARERQVPGMHRVEAAAEQADAFHSSAQSRARRKSLYSPASGVPGAGCHW
jgi:hypothetical protein